MPPVKLNPGNFNVALPGVRRNGEQPTDALGRLLQNLGIAAKDVAGTFERIEAEEAARVDELIDSNLMTEEEIKELEEQVKNPLALRTLRNRQGEARVQGISNELREELDRANDPVTAHELLRTRLNELVSSETNVDVQEGIRERFSTMAPGMLNAAAERRRARREEEDRVASTDLILGGLISDGPEAFSLLVAGQQDEDVANGKRSGPAVERAIESLKALYLSNPSQQATVVREGIRALQSDPRVELSSKHQVSLGLLKTSIDTDQQQRLNSMAAAQEEVQKQALAANLAIVGYLTERGISIPQDIANEMRAQAAQISPEEVRAVNGVLDVETGPGISGTAEARTHKWLFEKELSDPLTGVIGGKEDAELLAEYNVAVSAIDRETANTPELRNQALSRIRDRLIEDRNERKIRIQEATARRELTTKNEIRMTEIRLANALQALRSPDIDPVEAIELLNSLPDSTAAEIQDIKHDFALRAGPEARATFLNEVQAYLRSANLYLNVLPVQE